MIGFAPDEGVEELAARVRTFVDDLILPHEAELAADLDGEVRPGVPFSASLRALRSEARAAGLWNLHLPREAGGAGLSTIDYAVVCEQMGRSLVAPMVFNAHPPDSGNAEILAEHGTPEQRERWLAPLLAGDVRTCFAMTEASVAGSDPTLIQTGARLDGDAWVIDGEKWFATGAIGAALTIVMCVTEPDGDSRHGQASMLLVPTGTPGMTLVRAVPVMGHDAGPGHGQFRFEDCRIPADHILGERGRGFAIAQERLGPGRLHHCFRAIGGAERALEMLCLRALSREAFGGALADKQLVQDFIATSRLQIDQARLLAWRAACTIDLRGKAAARTEVSMAKIAAANAQQAVLDRAIQVHGALGLTEDVQLAAMWRQARGLRVLDGADEVHKMSVARRELRSWRRQEVAA